MTGVAPTLLSLDFVYTPTADVDRAIDQYVDAFGAQLEWKVRAMDTMVACLRVSETGPKVLLSEHLEGQTPILVYRVAEFADALSRLRAAGVTDVRELEIPHGPCASVRMSNGQRYAVYELVPGRDDPLRRPLRRVKTRVRLEHAMNGTVPLQGCVAQRRISR